MEIDASLMEIFLNEALAYLKTLEDPDKDLKAKGDAAHGMKGIAAMLEFTDLSQQASVLEHQLRGGKDEELAERVADLRDRLDVIQIQAKERFNLTVGDTEELIPKEITASEPAPARFFDDERDTQVEIEPLPPPSAPDRPRGTAGKEEDQDTEWDPETAAMLQGIFLEEASELMEGIDKALSDLRSDLENKDHIHSLFRLTHTLKGAAGTVGFTRISEAAHALENHFDDIREARRPMGRAQLDTVVSATDILNSMIEASTDRVAQKRLYDQLTLELAQRSADVSPEPKPPAVKPAVPEPETKPGPEPESESESGSGSEPEADPGPEPSERYMPTGDRRAGDRRGGERREEDRRIIRLPVERVDRLMEGVGQLIFSRTRFQRKTDEIQGLIRDLAQSHRAFRSALMGLRVTTDGMASHQRLTEVEVEFADEVANFERAVGGLLEDTEDLRRVSSRFQEDLVRLRMMSISYLMARLRRSARQIAASQGKKIEVIVDGEDTELDKTVVERLTDPLIHLVRNAVAHGVETPDERIQTGKPAVGTVHISAEQEGENVILRVLDDGRGIDLGKVRASLVHRAMMTDLQAERLSDDEALEAIFRPGFTTRRSADDVSGRGVGLDVVSDSIALLSGDLQVSTRVGEGTQFVIRLPLLTAISNALLFKVGGQVYGLSVSHVDQTGLLDDDQIDQLRRTGQVTFRGEPLKAIDLTSLLGVEAQRRGRYQQCIVARWANRRFVLTCDKTIGPREIVVKPLGPLISPLPIYCGATISGAGKVQLVLDPAGLAKTAGLRTTRDTVVPFQQQRARRILVCDDSRSIREVLSRILMQAGYNVEVASDGWDAWERMAAAAVDLLLTDLEMPRLDGYALIEKVRKKDQFRELPIVVLTSRTGDANRKRADLAGADIFITKPVNRRTILKHLRELLKN